jgi:methyltransferase (TIGR00027 family)
VAALRAIGNRERNPLLRNPDQLAVRFLSPAMRLRVELAPLRALTLRVVQRLLPGAYPFITVRTRHLDGILVDEVRAGVRRVAIVGAGADTRAYRFADSMPGVTVFELDHPVTSQWKQRQVARLFGRPPEHVRYLPIDLGRDRLDDALETIGTTEPVLFLWEGVTPYLSMEAIDATLAAIGRCAEGSSVAFDYYFPDPSAAVPRFQQYLRRHGEPVVSRMEPDSVAPALAAHGLSLVSNVDAQELSARHLAGRADLVSYCAIAHARR